MNTRTWAPLSLFLCACGSLPTETPTASPPGTGDGGRSTTFSNPPSSGEVDSDSGVAPSSAATGDDGGVGTQIEDAGGTLGKLLSGDSGDSGLTLVPGDAGCTQFTGPSLADASVSYSQCEGPSVPRNASCHPEFKPAGTGRCTVTDTSVMCTPVVTTVGGRAVYWQVPTGEVPAAGWPTVVVLQPSLAAPSGTWSADTTAPLGALNYVRMEALLLDNGFAVVAPTADNGGEWWDTNFPNYDTSEDATFIPALLDAIAGGTFGKSDPARLYAVGWSSGGFMSSRLGITYPKKFAAIGIHSGGFETCSTVCPGTIPALPPNHPPTLMLHGAQDVVVPVAVPTQYYDALVTNGTQAEIIVNPSTMHDFLPIAPAEFTCWFMEH